MKNGSITPYNNQLKSLVRLRWAALAGQLILVIVAIIHFEITLPHTSLIVVMGITTFSNLILERIYPRSPYDSSLLLGSVIQIDTLLLTALLYFSGGPTNPFSIVYLAHVSLAALLAGPIWTWITVILSTACFTWLFQFHVVIHELAMHHHDSHGAFSAHLYGMLGAFIMVASLLAFFLSKMAHTLTKQAQTIGDLRLITAEQEKLTALVTLAGGAAHELNTPLGTITLAAHELKKSLIADGINIDDTHDINLIIGQVQRCSRIIERMSSHAGEIQGELPTIFPLKSLTDSLYETLGEHVMNQITIDVPQDGLITAPFRGLVQVINALVDNALSASRGNPPVHLELKRTSTTLECQVMNQGTIDESMLRRIGEPFFTTKDSGKGMGLGVFLVKLFAQRLGGTFEIRSLHNGTTTATIILPQLYP